MSCAEGADFDVNTTADRFIRESVSSPGLSLSQQLMNAPLRLNLPITIAGLIVGWASYYRSRLEMNVARLRDDKLTLYAKEVAKLELEMAKSFAQTKIWKSVYQQRYGLAGQDWSPSTFIENAVQKNVPFLIVADGS